MPVIHKVNIPGQIYIFNSYDISSFNNNFYKFSLTRISISTKTLNLVLNNYISERSEKIERGEKPIALKINIC